MLLSPKNVRQLRCLISRGCDSTNGSYPDPPQQCQQFYHMQYSHLVDITGVDDVMPGGGDGDEDSGAVLAHLRLQAHLSSKGLR